MINYLRRILDRYRRQVRIALHLCFWFVAYLFFIYLKKPLMGISYWEVALVALKDLFFIGTIFYFLAYIVIPKFLLKQKFLLLIPSLIGIYYFYALGIYLEFSIIPNLIDVQGRGYLAYSSRVLAAGLLGVFTFVNSAEIVLDLTYLIFPALLVKLILQIIDLSTTRIRLERDNLNLELAFLKAQLNPHFLFNTLNSVYSLALHRSDQTADIVLKLSDLIRYTLYDSNSNSVSLEKEALFFKNYIELERVRYSSRVGIQFEMNGEFENLLIAPLIIFPFIDNAFKHGVDSTIANSWVSIRLEVVEGRQLMATIRNSVHSNSGKSLKPTGGIGIANAVKRLNLLYEDRHKLEIDKKQNEYSVSISISL